MYRIDLYICLFCYTVLSLTLLIACTDERLERKTDFDKNHNIVYYYSYEYDENGHVIKQIKYKDKKFNEKEMTGWYLVYKYDGNENLIQENCYNDKGVLENYNIYEYDDYNRKIKETNFYKDQNTILNYTTYQYDKNVVKGTRYNDESVIIGYLNLIYDDKNCLIRKHQLNHNDSLEKYTVFDYEMSRLIKETQYDRNNNVETYSLLEYF